MAALRRIFVSYEYKRDHDLKNNFIRQARSRGLPVRIQDVSLEEDHRTLDWVKKAKDRIGQCHLVVVLIGQDTYSAAGVRKEVDIARGFQIPIIQIRPSNRPYGRVRGAGEEYPWDWDVLGPILPEEIMPNIENLIFHLAGIPVNGRALDRAITVAGHLVEFALTERWQGLSDRERKVLVKPSAKRLFDGYMRRRKLLNQRPREAAEEAIIEELVF